MLPFRFILVPVLATLLAIVPAEAQEENLFGKSEASESALIGILYDLKQTQSLKPIHMNTKTYGEVIDKFLGSNWDETVLNKYYRVTRPLYATQIFIPLIDANSAPKAFGVEKIVRPSYWLIHYKGQVAAPSAGFWRFWGNGEEVCSVGIDGKNVLLANWREITTPSVAWKPPGLPGQKVANSAIRPGEWFELKKGQVVDLDVLIGERAGGVFCAFLLIEKRGEIYGPPVAGAPLLPVFQLAPFNTPQPASAKTGPSIAPNGPIWKGFQ